VIIDGIDTTRFMQNPVMMLSHSYQGAPVARVTSLYKSQYDGVPALLGTAHFPPGRQQSDEALADVRSGLLSAVSIGFLAHEAIGRTLPGQKGRTITRSELLEISLVPVPSCRSCLITSKAHQEATMKACSCDDVEIEFVHDDELELTPAQLRALPRLVRSLMPRIVKDVLDDEHGEIDVDSEHFKTHFPQVLARCFLDVLRTEFPKAIGREVAQAVGRLRGRAEYYV
jgi:hypothetical protein